VNLVFESDAQCCAECEHAINGAVIDGSSFPDGWHCDVNDVLSTHRTASDHAGAICRDKKLWETIWKEEQDG